MLDDGCNCRVALVEIGGNEYNINYYDWDYKGPEGKSMGVLLCLHGISRTGRDFDYVARGLRKSYRVICPDFIGRGKSDWLIDKSYYHYPAYEDMIIRFLDAIGVSKVTLLGTSMGGFTGLRVAANHPEYVEALVLNDVGAHVPKAVLKGSLFYLRPKFFADAAAVMKYMRNYLSPLGLTCEQHLEYMAWNSVMPHPDGGYIYNYDPAIAETYATIANQLPESGSDLWDLWNNINAPTYLIRGRQSRFVSPETFKKMLESDRVVDYIEYPNAGHAPGLASDQEISNLTDWLAIKHW